MVQHFRRQGGKAGREKCQQSVTAKPILKKEKEKGKEVEERKTLPQENSWGKRKKRQKKIHRNE